MKSQSFSRQISEKKKMIEATQLIKIIKLRPILIYFKSSSEWYLYIFIDSAIGIEISGALVLLVPRDDYLLKKLSFVSFILSKKMICIFGFQT